MTGQAGCKLYQALSVQASRQLTKWHSGWHWDRVSTAIRSTCDDESACMPASVSHPVH